MKPNGWFSGLAGNLARATGYFSSFSCQRYTMAERAGLVRAALSRGQQTKFLGFWVSCLSKKAFRTQLREIFFECEYSFKAETDSPAILDCGANIGLATLFFKYLYPKARITSFEADPTTASILQKNVERNRLQDVSVHNLMLSNMEGEHPFYIAADVDGSLRMSANPGRISRHREIMVKAGKLSRYIQGPIDLLKLDVEGAEWDVMGDLKESGKLALVQRMAIEYHHKIGGQASRLAGFLALLEQEGFEYQIAATGADPISRQGVFQDLLIGAYRPSPGNFA
ncbi:MAG: FkbM family methyltransferase [Terracidiphilus sp.]